MKFALRAPYSERIFFSRPYIWTTPYFGRISAKYCQLLIFSNFFSVNFRILFLNGSQDI